MTRAAAGGSELLEELSQARLVCRDLAIVLTVGALEVSVGDQSRATVTGTGQINDVEIVARDDAIEVRIDEIQARRGAPVTQQARLEVRAFERLSQQRIV